MPSRVPGVLLAPLLTALLAVGAHAFQLERIATGLDRPVFLTAPPGDSERLFIVEQRGDIRIVRRSDGVLLGTPFLSLSGLSTGNEQGLLGLAFDPDYATNGFFYVYITDPTSRILRFQVSAADPDVADPASELQLLAFSQPQSNHNGGWIAFGGDDLLYIASGDGGGSDDNDTGHTSGIGNAQDTTDNLLGKILRIDPGADQFPADPDRNYAIPAGNPFVGVTGDDEIWVYGLRNPWRASFDRETGDLYIGDVGQGSCEEIDVQPATSPGGENYGWRLREGSIATPSGGVGGAPPPGAIDPIFDYPHGGATCSGPPAGFVGISVTGGYVYRLPSPELEGRYFFADFGTADIWSLVWDGSDPGGFDGTNYLSLVDHSGDPRFAPAVGSIGTISSFGEDADGNLYVLDLDGEVFVLPEPGGPLSHAAGALVLLGLAGRRRAPDRRRGGVLRRV